MLFQFGGLISDAVVSQSVLHAKTCLLGQASGLNADSSALPNSKISTAMNSNAVRQGKKRRAEAAGSDDCGHEQCDKPATPVQKRLCVSTVAAGDAAAPISQGQINPQEEDQGRDQGRSKGRKGMSRKKVKGRTKREGALIRMQEVEDVDMDACQQHLPYLAHEGSLDVAAGLTAMQHNSLGAGQHIGY